MSKIKTKTIKTKKCIYCKLKLPKDDFNLNYKICIQCEKHREKHKIEIKLKLKKLLTINFD